MDMTGRGTRRPIWGGILLTRREGKVWMSPGQELWDCRCHVGGGAGSGRLEQPTRRRQQRRAFAGPKGMRMKAEADLLR